MRVTVVQGTLDRNHHNRFNPKGPGGKTLADRSLAAKQSFRSPCEGELSLIVALAFECIA